MAKDALPLDPKSQQPVPAPAPETKTGMPLKKILMFGGPIVVVQIVIIYFLVTKFIAPSTGQAPESPSSAAQEEKKGEDHQTTQIVVIKDVIVNPAGTNGSRLLVTTIGLEVPTTEAKVELEQKEVQTRDILVTVLSGKRLEDLAAPEQREALREEICSRVNKLLQSSKLKNVYISKFIIQ